MASFKELTLEQMEKARACKDADELVQLADAEGLELTDEQLDAIAGCLAICFGKMAPLMFGGGA